MMCGGPSSYAFRGAARTEFDATFRSASKGVAKHRFNARVTAAKGNVKVFFRRGLDALKDVEMPPSKKVAAVAAAAGLLYGAYKHKDEVQTQLKDGVESFMLYFKDNPNSRASKSDILANPDAQDAMEQMQAAVDKSKDVAKGVAQTWSATAEDLGQCIVGANVTHMGEDPTAVFTEFLESAGTAGDESGAGGLAKAISEEVPRKDASGVMAAALGVLGFGALLAATAPAKPKKPPPHYTPGYPGQPGYKKMANESNRWQSLSDRIRRRPGFHATE